MPDLGQMIGSSGIDLASLGSRFGLDAGQTQAAMGSLMPAILGGMQDRANADDLDPVAQAGNAMGVPDVDAGNGVLGHIFGSKDVSRQVADHAAGQSGIPSSVLKAMLPIAAAMAAKHLATNSGQGGGGGMGGLLGSLMGGGAGGGLGDLLGGGGGNPLDAILGGRR